MTGPITAVESDIRAESSSENSWDESGLSAGFTNREADDFAIGIVGDIHLEPGQMELFHTARNQLQAALGHQNAQCSRLVQLGDLGGYDYGPGGWQCFEIAKDYLDSFELPTALVAGNHDLEGAEFESDEENLLAWKKAFGQRHYWSAQLGSVKCLGMSTTRFRSNKNSVHEVHIDDEQIDWFKKELQAANGAPVIVFTHAPALGSGLKTVEGVHVKNRCAWLNHSSQSGVFIDLVQEFPNIVLWFSGHYHLSQDYGNSISVRNRCSFAQVGVIGECDRDGQHQSRILRGSKSGFKLSTLNHATGEERLDLAQDWAQLPQANVTVDFWPAVLPFSNGTDQNAREKDMKELSESGDEWFGAGGDCLLRRTGNLFLEYNAKYRAAVGAVCTDLDGEQMIRLINDKQHEVHCKLSSNSWPHEDGASATEVQILNRHGRILRTLNRNDEGTFFQIFQKNKWRAKALQPQSLQSA